MKSQPLLRIVLVLLSIVVLLFGANQTSAQSPPARKPIDPAKLAEREHYADEAFRLKNEKKSAEAIAALRKALAVHLEIAPEDITSSLGMLEWMVDLASEADDLATAESLLSQAHDLTKQRYGADDWRTIDARLQLELVHKHRTVAPAEHNELLAGQRLADKANELESQGKLEMAAKAAEHVAAIQKRIFGAKHPQYAASLNNLAGKYAKRADYARAIPLAVEALAIVKEAYGARHPTYATCLNNLGSMYVLMGDSARAESHYLEALKIRKEVLGTNNSDYAASLNDLAGLYVNMGDFARAEPLCVEANTILKKLPGAKHPTYTASLINLAWLHTNLGDYARARSICVEAHSIVKQALGTKHPEYATAIHNLAMLYDRMGDYARAAPLNAEALAIRKEILGTRHPDYASSLNNSGSVYLNMGDYARAEPLYVESVAILKEVVGTKHPDYAMALQNLGMLYQTMNDDKRAEPLFVEALALLKENVGTRHPRYATSLNNLASLYMRRGDYRRAESLFIEAGAIHKAAFGARHSDYATNLNNLAALYEKMGQDARAEPLHLEGLAIRKETLGAKHPEYAASLCNLAGLYTRVGYHARAEPLYREALDVFRASLDETASVQSERQQLKMSETVRSQLDAYIALGANTERYPQNIFSQVLAWKGSTLVRQRAMRSAARDPAIADKFRRLQGVAGQLASLSRAVPANEEPRAAWRTRLAELTQDKERLEAELSGKSATFRRGTKPVTLEELSAALPKGTVLLDYLEYTGLSAMPQMRMLSITHQQLAVFVVRSTGNAEADVTLIPLGAIESIEDAVDAWRAKLGEGPEAEEAGTTLRQLIWEPLEKHLAGAETILVSTDGALGRLPLGALPGKALGTYLVEDHRLAMIPVPRLLPDLVAPATDSRPLAHELLLLGDVDYDAAAGMPSPATADVAANNSGTRAPQAAGSHFPRLSGTKDEITAIADLYGGLSENDRVVSLTAADATEARFREFAPQCRTLHLATHGFFAPESIRSVATSATSPQPAGAQEVTVGGYSPNLLSGLALTGANRPPSTTGDDGILTAEEIVALPLDGARLVTLSACETGLGRAAGGEGLLGLQRAFQVSGARTTIASYWKVDDQVTRVLMERFYKNLAASTPTKPIGMLDALREAQLWVLRHPQEVATATTRGLGTVKTLPGGGVPNVAGPTPSTTATRSPIKHWAAFSLSGDWR